MILVIALWVVYLNITLPKSAEMSTGTSTEAIAPLPAREETRPSFFNTLGIGWGVVWGSIQKNISDMGNMAGTEWLNVKNLFDRTNELKIEKPNNGN